MTAEINLDQISKYQKNLDNRKDSKVIERAVTHQGILESSEDFTAEGKMTPVFSIDLSTGKVADQKQSGRCWMFAALNTMRIHLMNTYKVPDDFELSQNYTNFWDKFEKSNYFLENVLKTADQPLDSRKVAWLMATPQQDGGQWDMLCALIEKYGIVPKSAMPETFNSSRSAQLNKFLNLKLRHDAVALRELVANKASDEKIAETKDSMMNEVYRMLTYALGEPATKFDFEYRDKDKNYHFDAGITPQEFFKKYVNLNLEDYVSLINSPTDDKPFNKTYTIEMLGNVVNGRPVKHLNLEMSELKKLAIKQLQNGESVWFGSDVGQSSNTKKGIMDTNLYAPDEMFDSDLSMSKAERLDYGESLMTHAMVITGVDLVNGEPTKWKVENSWGEKVGTKGYFVMSDDWMNEFVYQFVINKKYLTDAQLEAQKQDPVVLKPWDPMGALA
ncbi:aminopeptidase C [Lentilactobacillus kefiri]|uniref:Aminopeptidase n=2 Tax=Lentilactobacillus kefiri TaxID=33962 RepID=A0A8E1RIC4_LENKE|nr:C1 family peptidase [Lentilactobacillus kefiri]KRL54251.1 Bleomycin hydrolase [Lentilactobacillus parakefiri DSM 10551]KRM49903.1 Bleomycin hydrolase [Lentilactobacillus kefiri DSM 20587 = JCM 5818]MCJ2161455.1 C1 family peptidase [Lentilactobacillus kefiri]MCP9368392.1 C1 family peptidase [Lentilactobacillus kefiri]MDH5107781.1 C1 family peptidase [Lentilactobacillus kefiri]